MQLADLLEGFMDNIQEDGRIGATHISLYVSLLYFWQQNQFENPLRINRREVMKGAKIFARHTYNQRINELCRYGYILYQPSSDPRQCSLVTLNAFN